MDRIRRRQSRAHLALTLTAPFTRFIFSAGHAAHVSRKQRDSLGKFPLQLGREEPVAEVLEEGATRRLRVVAQAALREKRKSYLIARECRGQGRDNHLVGGAALQ